MLTGEQFTPKKAATTSGIHNKKDRKIKTKRGIKQLKLTKSSSNSSKITKALKSLRITKKKDPVIKETNLMSS